MVERDSAPVVRVRDRGWNIPAIEKIEAMTNSESKFRSRLLWGLQSRLVEHWNEFSSEHSGGVKAEYNNENESLIEFTCRYALFLSEFRHAKKSGDEVAIYYYSIRTRSYDSTFKAWRQIALLNDQIDDLGEDFFQRLMALSFDVGMVCRGLQLIFRNQMNVSEHLIASTIGRSKGGKIRHMNDPRAQDKLFIYECWQSWESNPSAYPGPTAFAKDMLEKVDNLTSDTQVIMRWVREWRSGKAGPQR